MFKSYLKIALRNLKRQKGYTLINILGLAIGIAGCLLICLYPAFPKYCNDETGITIIII